MIFWRSSGDLYSDPLAKFSGKIKLAKVEKSVTFRDAMKVEDDFGHQFGIPRPNPEQVAKVFCNYLPGFSLDGRF